MEHCFIFKQRINLNSDEMGKIVQLSGKTMKTLSDEVDGQPVTAIF